MITLYHCTRARSLRALWALEELGLPYELNVLPFPPRQDPNYLKINPLGTTPWLTDGAVTMNESSAMCQYIATCSDGNMLALAPDHKEYGNWLNWIAFGEGSLTYPLSLVLHYGKWYERIKPGSPQHLDVEAYYKQAFDNAMLMVERALQGRDYLVDNRFTVADISVAYNFKLLEVMGLDGELSPVLETYWQRLKQREAYRKTQVLAAEYEGV